MSNVATSAGDNLVTGFTVILKKDIDKNEAERIKTVLNSIKNVDSVISVELDAMGVINRRKVRNEIREKLRNWLNSEK